MISRLKALKQLKFLESKTKNMRLAAENWDNSWQTLVAIILSARTKDEVTIKICSSLFEKYPNPEKFSKLNIQEIKQLIYSINFHNNKAKNLFFMNKKLLEEFSGKIPKTIEEILTLPGVGLKTANVFFAEYGNPNIGVDTHVNYISRYLGWTNHNDQKNIEKDIKKIFQKKYWNNINSTLVRFGKTYTSRKEKNNLLDIIKNIP